MSLATCATCQITWIPGCLPEYPILGVLKFWGPLGVLGDMQMKRLGVRSLMKRITRKGLDAIPTRPSLESLVDLKL